MYNLYFLRDTMLCIFMLIMSGSSFIHPLPTSRARSWQRPAVSHASILPVSSPRNAVVLGSSRVVQTTTTMAAAPAVAGYRMLEPAKRSWTSIPQLWDFVSTEIPHQIALVDSLHGNETVAYTYTQLKGRITRLAGAMQVLGVKSGDCVSMFAENSNRWLTTEQGIMMAGGANAVRGMTAPVEELQYIYGNSRSVGVVVEKAGQLKNLLTIGKGLTGPQGPPKFIFVLYAEGRSSAEIRSSFGVPADIVVMTFQEAIAMNAPCRPVPDITPDSVATIVYTSGTTSNPKGVVLRHRNLLHQMVENSFNRNKGQHYDPWVGDVFVSILPCWHIFERTAEYFMLSRGVKMVYSNVRNFKNDLAKHKPRFLVGVPRLFETIYKSAMSNFDSQPASKKRLIAIFTTASTIFMKANRIRTGLVIRKKAPSIIEKAIATIIMGLMYPIVKFADKAVWSKIREGMGGEIKVVVSGGSALPTRLEDFFEMINQKVVVGYGLTETSPVICNRVVEHNLRGSVGKPPPGTTIKLVNPETRQPVPIGEVGVVCAKGPQVMSEYNNDPQSTAQVMDSDNFFYTGDLGRINPATGDLILTGRAKDTIVLSNGENIEPEPIENAALSGCSLIDQIMLVGQDERFLGAIAVISATGLETAGLISREERQKLTKLLGATPLSLGVLGTPQEKAAAQKIIDTKPIKTAVLAELKRIGKASGSRSHEIVNDVILRFEPFTIPNGFMTQTIKIKRNVVADALKADIKALYE